MKKVMTHNGILQNNKTGEVIKIMLRETKHCWVGLNGKRYLKTTGRAPGQYIGGKDLMLMTLQPDSVKRTEVW